MECDVLLSQWDRWFACGSALFVSNSVFFCSVLTVFLCIRSIFYFVDDYG